MSYETKSRSELDELDERDDRVRSLLKTYIRHCYEEADAMEREVKRLRSEANRIENACYDGDYSADVFRGILRPEDIESLCNVTPTNLLQEDE